MSLAIALPGSFSPPPDLGRVGWGPKNLRRLPCIARFRLPTYNLTIPNDRWSIPVPVSALAWIGGYYLLINFITLAVWGWDKLAAVTRRWRTPERTLRRLIYAGGFAGGLAGMLIFHHKTRHPAFYRVLVLTTAAHAAAWSGLLLTAHV